MADLFSALNHGLEGTPLLALSAAFTWGVLSLVLSPCHLTSIPLIVGFISGQGRRIPALRAFLLSLAFTLGILITIAVIGVVTAALGRLIGQVGAWAHYGVAVVFFAVGLHLLGLFSLPWSGAGDVGLRSRGVFAAFVLGLIFGIALGPCTFAFMAPVLGYSLKVSADNMIYGSLLLVSYGIGHGIMIVVAGTSTEVVQRMLKWNERSKGMDLLRKACGVLVLLGGLYLIYTAP